MPPPLFFFRWRSNDWKKLLAVITKSSASILYWKAPLLSQSYVAPPNKAELVMEADKIRSLWQVGSFRLCRHWLFRRRPVLSPSCVRSLNSVIYTKLREANFMCGRITTWLGLEIRQSAPICNRTSDLWGLNYFYMEYVLRLKSK